MIAGKTQNLADFRPMRIFFSFPGLILIIPSKIPSGQSVPVSQVRSVTCVSGPDKKTSGGEGGILPTPNLSSC
jgi:hypothetical protein